MRTRHVTLNKNVMTAAMRRTHMLDVEVMRENTANINSLDYHQ